MFPEFEYKLFVDGAFQSTMTNYDWIFQRGLALAIYKELDYTNAKSIYITDKWIGDFGRVIISKEPIFYPNQNKQYYLKF